MPLYKFQYRCRRCSIVFYPKGIHASNSDKPLVFLASALHPQNPDAKDPTVPDLLTAHACGFDCVGVADLIGFEPVP